MDYQEVLADLQRVIDQGDSSLFADAKEAIEELMRANETLRNEVATLTANLEAAAEYRHRAEVALQEALARQ